LKKERKKKEEEKKRKERAKVSSWFILIKVRRVFLFFHFIQYSREPLVIKVLFSIKDLKQRRS